VLLADSLPATPAEQQLSWLLQATVHPPANPVAVVAGHFDQAFLQQVPAAQLVTVVSELNGPTGMHLVRLANESPTELVAIAKETRSELTITLTVDGAGLINGLLFGPHLPPAPKNWSQLDRRLAALAPDTSFLAARISSDGECSPVNQVAATTPRPLASMFKLFVLGALAHQIAAGTVSWNQELTVTNALRSTGSVPGSLQYSPAGTQVTVEETADKMISISDNTAADMLINLVGRSAAEAQVHQWSQGATLDNPFLTTRELFLLHYYDYPVLADSYLGIDRQKRAAYLSSSVDPLPLSQIQASNEPRDIDSLEWFASADDVCRAFSGLSDLSKKPGLSPVASALSINNGGIGLDSTTWPTVWFKGGSEPGVWTLGYLARDSQGRTFVITALASDPSVRLDGASMFEFQALIRSAFNLSK
jgi:beta-lactamase class A